ncbi:MAG: sigma-70 family RNA polymerase sigma factor [Ruminococcus sp.]|nr:sigma-70 family RNA polymerase sigma factor [Ruminococcus sp.]
MTVHKAMRKLSPDYQQVLWLTYFEDMSNKEAAAVMKKSVRSIESLLYRARKSLRSQLEMEGFDYEKL